MSPTFRLPGPFRRRLPFIHWGIVPLIIPEMGSTISCSQDRSQTVASQFGYRLNGLASGGGVDVELDVRCPIDSYLRSNSPSLFSFF